MKVREVIWLCLLASALLICSAALAAPRQCVLVEGFTNTSCSWCATYNPNIRLALNSMGRDTCIKISYHVWWPGAGDPMYTWNTSEVTARTQYYGVSGVPDLFVDHVNVANLADTSSIKATVRTRYATPSPCTMGLSAVQSGTTSFRFVASVTAEQDMSGGNYRLYAVLINDLITYGSPPGNNGETAFPDVFRDMYPNATPGQTISLAPGQTYDMDGLLTRDASWALDNCSVIAFVQNATNRDIVQATWAHITTTPGSIALTSPNGGEAWFSGEQRAITWTSSNLSQNIKIQVMRDFPTGAWQVIAPSTPNTGSYTWTVSSPGAAAARVKVSGVTQTVTGDTSNANFTIAGLALTAPNGGETFYNGDVATITWNALSMTENVRVEVNRSYPGSSWETLAASAPNTGTYAWTVTAPGSTTARVRVTGITHPAACDTSDANFTVIIRSVTVTSPNGGEVWTAPTVHPITWSWQNVTGQFNIEINRNYPAGSWDVLASGVAPSGTFSWPVNSPGSTNVRVRITSVTYPIATDMSDANFTVVIPNLTPVLKHDALCDFAPGTGQVVALASDPSYLLTISSVKMFYRRHGQTAFDSLAMSLTGNPNEYAASLAFLATGSYDYFVRTLDDGGIAVTVPAGAPTKYYRFSVYGLAANALSYDDGSADSYSWVVADSGSLFQWAVKFGPVSTPFALSGARFAASRSKPDTIHTPVIVSVYAADGPGGMPGTLIYRKLAGSVGNVIGGLPAGTNWAQVSFEDSLGTTPMITVPEFYIAVGNFEVNKFEAVGRDSTGVNNHRSYLYDACLDEWISEDDAGSTNTHPGNRLIRAYGSQFNLTMIREGNDLVMRWADLGSPAYRVYSSATAGGPYDTLEGTVTTNGFTITNGANGTALRRFYIVYPTSD